MSEKKLIAEKIDNVKVKAGRLVRVRNIVQKPGASAYYVAVWVEDADGRNERCLLFTQKELDKAEARARKNPEDLPKKNWLEDITD